jgi:hypothetical protein
MLNPERALEMQKIMNADEVKNDLAPAKPRYRMVNGEWESVPSRDA